MEITNSGYHSIECLYCGMPEGKQALTDAMSDGKITWDEFQRLDKLYYKLRDERVRKTINELIK